MAPTAQDAANSVLKLTLARVVLDSEQGDEIRSRAGDALAYVVLHSYEDAVRYLRMTADSCHVPSREWAQGLLDDWRYVAQHPGDPLPDRINPFLPGRRV